MIIYPAIDLINGQCVRLYKGDFAQQDTYDVTPQQTAIGYRSAGAEWMHVVDLDGARDPAKRQTALIRDIIKASDLKVQTGGGVRSMEDVEILLKAGASRVVIGSLSVRNPELVRAMLAQFGAEKICIAADVMPEDEDYMIAVSGWQDRSDTRLYDLLDEYSAAGLKHVLCTDISRDGTMSGCNRALYGDLSTRYPQLDIQASGGVHALEDLKGLQSAGAIIGKALYEGAFTLAEALEVAGC